MPLYRYILILSFNRIIMYGYIQSIHITNFIKIFINNFVELCTFGRKCYLQLINSYVIMKQYTLKQSENSIMISIIYERYQEVING